MADEHDAKKAKTEAQHARTQFLNVFNDLRNEVLADPMLSQKDASSYMCRMMDYNVPGGKLNRGMAVKDVLLGLKPGATAEEQLQADQLGWAIEFLQAYFLVADDIMDNSVTRRGHPCWYKVDGVGMVAINDGILLEQIIYFILRKHFRKHSAYTDLLDLFLETTHQTAHGQLLDLITAPAGSVDTSKYTMERYLDIVTYKTSYYSFFLPVACGMHLAGVTDEAAFAKAKEILVQMGVYFQIQDDYLDCFADPEVLGKVGTDIQDNKCSWLVCNALLLASDEQKAVIEANYGKDDANSIQKIKDLYKELDLEKKFKDFEAESYVKLSAMIDEQKAVPKIAFTGLLEKIYKRVK